MLILTKIPISFKQLQKRKSKIDHIDKLRSFNININIKIPIRQIKVKKYKIFRIQ